MQFRPIILKHKERIKWSSVTHIRIKSTVADTAACQLILDHLQSKANHERVVPLADVLKDFPAVRKKLKHLRATRMDLRHMANLRDSGENSQDKGLIELGSMEDVPAVNGLAVELLQNDRIRT